MFGTYNLDAMNETDVREIIVRPLLHQLGYRQGTDATIRTEVTFRYGKAFLGRKDPLKDPDLKDLRGRADYVCDVVSFGRWAVEVKGPNEPLDLDTSQQAHTYAAHPEVAAVLYVITNGREFKVYRTSYPDAPIFEWKTAETADHLMTIRNLLSPEAIKRRVYIPLDTGKPLGNGVGSSVRIVGGTLIYGEHHTDSPQLQQGLAQVNGLRAAITGQAVQRNEDGQIVATVAVAGPYSLLDALNKAAGMTEYVFRTSDEYISTDIEQPTLFQNFVFASIPRGTVIDLPIIPHLRSFQLPFELRMTAYTQAAGFLDGDRFSGTFGIDYHLEFVDLPLMRGHLPEKATMYGEGVFDLIFIPA